MYVFEHKVFKNIFVITMDVVNEQFILCNEELCDLYRSCGVVVVKYMSRRLCCAGCVARVDITCDLSKTLIVVKVVKFGKL